jgi:hypothetical protein
MAMQRRRIEHVAAIPPAIHYKLHVGDDPPPRVRGWLLGLQTDDEELEQIWRRHRFSLLAEAEQNGFTPWTAHRFDGGPHVPETPKLRRWAASFHAAHRY